MLNKNEIKTVNVPIAPEIPLLTFFPKKTLKRNPTNGDKSNNHKYNGKLQLSVIKM